MAATASTERNHEGVIEDSDIGPIHNTIIGVGWSS